MEFQRDADTQWQPYSWQKKTALQQPAYPSRTALRNVISRLSELPPLVTSWEIEFLKDELADAVRGRSFLMQGGDCSESFIDCKPSIITNKLKILLQMSLVLVYGGRKKVIEVGRFGGQYAKPRSSDVETREGVELPSYRGDMINREEFAKSSRTPDPERMIQAYKHSALTLNFIRSLVEGGFADFHHPEYWDLGFMSHSPQAKEYQKIVDAMENSLMFMETLSEKKVSEINRVKFYTSHEGLLLYYESAQTRQVPRRKGWYNLGTHFPWIGDRTRNLDGAHIEYFRGIANPVGVKIGPSVSPEELVELAEVLNPHNEPGRLTLIHRFGKDRIAECLPPLISSIQKAGKQVLWCCDPMHGNTELTKEGLKTRKFDNIMLELEQAFDIHADHGSLLGGVHAELTGDNVTECIGGARGLNEKQLFASYQTQVDPRLNYEQALEMAFMIAGKMQKMERQKRKRP